MTKQQVDLTFYTPSWNWCEVKNRGRRTKSGEQCKFCKEVKKRGAATMYYCLIYDENLSVIDGSVRKCAGCLNAGMFSTDKISEPVPEAPTRKASEACKIAKAVINAHKKEYNALRKGGFPEFLAYDGASANVLGAWQEETTPDVTDYSYILED